jgi:hypothetical protein
MQPTIVTGYVPLPGHPKSERYLELGQRLLDTGLPIRAYLGSEVLHQLDIKPTVDASPFDLADCWLWKHIKEMNPNVPPTDNPTKDTASFHMLQLQKARWAAYSVLGGAPLAIWVDFGILHVPGITEDIIKQFYDRVCLALYRGSLALDVINMPSIWGLYSDSIVDHDRPNWYCAGGLFTLPRNLGRWFSKEVERRTLKHLCATNCLTWEVNIWAELMRDNPELFAGWRCDHNETMFTGFTGVRP